MHQFTTVFSNDFQIFSSKRSLKANSHRYARHEKTVLSVSRPLRQIKSINQSAVWIGFQTTQDCRRKKIWSLNTFRAIVQFTPAHQTRHREDRLVVSGRRCELGNSWIKLDQLGLFIDFWAKRSFDVICFLRCHRSVRRSPCALATPTATSDGN